jgi:hypothetical protein
LDEIRANPRARSALLRVAEKLDPLRGGADRPAVSPRARRSAI